MYFGLFTSQVFTYVREWSEGDDGMIHRLLGRVGTSTYLGHLIQDCLVRMSYHGVSVFSLTLSAPWYPCLLCCMPQ